MGHESHLPNFSSSKSDGDLFGFRQSIAKIPRLTVTQHIKSMTIRRRRTPATAIPTIAIDEMFIRLSATPMTSKPRNKRKGFDWESKNKDVEKCVKLETIKVNKKTWSLNQRGLRLVIYMFLDMHFSFLLISLSCRLQLLVWMLMTGVGKGVSFLLQ